MSGGLRDAGPPGLTAEEMEAVRELRQGGGTYYVTQERAFAPGIAGEWPAVIPKPKSKNGRLVKRTWPVSAREEHECTYPRGDGPCPECAALARAGDTSGVGGLSDQETP